MEKGVNTPVSNEIKDTQSVQLGSPGMNEPPIEGFLEPNARMQMFKPRLLLNQKIDVVRPE